MWCRKTSVFLIVFEGSYQQLLHSGTSTGQMLSQHGDFKAEPRPVGETFPLRHAVLHNLKDISIDLPMDAFVAIAGVAGSGKSSCFSPSHVQSIIKVSQSSLSGTQSGPQTSRAVGNSLEMQAHGHCRPT